jgi:hypothetical protein
MLIILSAVCKTAPAVNSYNFEVIDDSFVNNHSKNFNDIFFNSINSLGFIKVF